MNSPASSELRKSVAPEFVYGSGTIRYVGRYAKNFGAGTALAVSDVAPIAPDTTTTMPADLTAATGPDALVHANKTKGSVKTRRKTAGWDPSFPPAYPSDHLSVNVDSVP